MATPGAPTNSSEHGGKMEHKASSPGWNPAGLPWNLQDLRTEMILADGTATGVTGEMMGSPFTGIGVNRVRQSYPEVRSTWIDPWVPPSFFLKDRQRGTVRRLPRKCLYNDPVKVP